MEGHLAQRLGAPNTGLHSHHPGFFEVQADVSPGGLAAQADAPLAGIFLPQREIGIDQ